MRLELFGVAVLNGDPRPPSSAIGTRDPGRATLRQGPVCVWARGGEQSLAPALAVCHDPVRDRHALALARIDDPDVLPAPTGSWQGAEAAARLCQGWIDHGEEDLGRVGGDWVLVGWDGRARRFVLARDPLGKIRACHARLDGCLVFGLDIRDLLALPGVSREPDRVMLGRLHVLALSESPDHRTFYENIQHVTPGHALVAESGRTTTRALWQVSDITPITSASGQDAVMGFVERFEAAVARRLPEKGRTGATLSGGLDSGSVSVIAAGQLSRQGERLCAFTSVPLFSAEGLAPTSRTVDEGPLAAATARAGNMEHVLLDCRDSTPIQGIRDWLALCAQPIHAALNAHWMLAILRACAERGIEVVLTGESGNAVVSHAGDPVAFMRSLLLGGRLDRAAREGFLLAANKGIRPAVGTVVRALKPRAYERFRVSGRLKGPFWTAYSALKPDADQGLGEIARTQGCYVPEKINLYGPEELRKVLVDMARYYPVGYQQPAQALDLDVRDPTLDLELTGYCLGLSERHYYGDGQDKRLVREAMAGRLPDAVLFGRRKGLQAADIIMRLRKASHEVDEALAQVRHSRLAAEFLDVPRIEKVWDRVQERADPSLTFLTHAILLKGLMVGLFLVDCEGRA